MPDLLEEGSWDLVKNSFFSNYFDIKSGFTQQNVIVIYLLNCFVLLNHKAMFKSCLGNRIGVSQISRCAKLDYTSVKME